MSDAVFGCPSCATTAGRAVCPVHRDGILASVSLAEVNVNATGTYLKSMPESLREALAAEVQRHMEGYGCTNVKVTVTESK